MWPWRKKKKVNAPPPDALNVRHSWVNAKPGSNTTLTIYPTAQPAGKATYATPIKEHDLADKWPLDRADATWNHFDRVPDGGDPRIYYARRERNKNERNLIERRIGTPQTEVAHSSSVRGNDAKWVAPPNVRLTEHLIPVNGHGLWNPLFGQHTAVNQNLTGIHSSLALVHRNYPIGGMNPQQRMRNTMRIIPPSYDATSADIDSSTQFSTAAGLYISPGANVPGVGYGLRGGF